MPKHFDDAEIGDILRLACSFREQATLDELKNPKLGERKREAVYAFGTGEAMLLQACWPEWRSAYPTQLALGPLLQTAWETCAATGPGGERG